jgi:probable phosphoglycerate mutase
VTSGTGDSSEPLVDEDLDATLLLVRHGESTYVAEGRFQGQAETPLSEAGLAQARLAAARIALPHGSPALPVPRGEALEIVHSPLRRTTQTAEAVEQAILEREAASVEGSPVLPIRRPDPAFLEIGQGEWEGLLNTEIDARWGDVLATWRRRPLEAWAPGGESLAEVQARVRPGLRRIIERLAAAPRIDGRRRDHVLGYGDPVADQPWTILVGHDGVFKIVLLTLFDIPLDRFWTFPFALCGISVVEFRAGRATMRAHNLTEHLAPLLDERSQALTEARQRSGAL